MASNTPNNLRDAIPESDRAPLKQMIDDYVKANPKVDNFYLQLLSAYLLRPETLGRPFDTTRTKLELSEMVKSGELTQIQADVLNFNLTKRLTMVNTTLSSQIAQSEWQYGESQLKEAQRVLQNASEVKKLTAQLQDFQKWATANNSKQTLITQAKFNEINKFMLGGLIFNAGNMYMEKASAPYKEKKQTVPAAITAIGGFFKRIGNHLNSTNIFSSVMNEINTDKKGLGEKLHSKSLETLLIGAKNANALRNEVTRVLDSVKKQHDYMLMDNNTKVKYLTELKTNLQTTLLKGNENQKGNENYAKEVGNLINKEIAVLNGSSPEEKASWRQTMNKRLSTTLQVAAQFKDDLSGIAEALKSKPLQAEVDLKDVDHPLPSSKAEPVKKEPVKEPVKKGPQEGWEKGKVEPEQPRSKVKMGR